MEVTWTFPGYVDQRSLENPSTKLSDPDDWLWDALGATKSATGQRIGRKEALTYAAFWRGVSLISRDVAKIPAKTFERQADGGKEVATGHPSYPLIRRRANSETTAFQFRQTLQSHAMLHGNGYAFIDRSRRNGNPLQLIQLDPTSVSVVRVSGRLWYIVRIPVERDELGSVTVWQERKVDPSEMFHIRGLGWDGLVGYDVLTYARETLGMGLAAREYGARFFGNNAQPSLILEAPAGMNKQAADHIRNNWNDMKQGLENAHKTAILWEGLTAKVLSPTARESQLQELRGFEIREIANIIGVPPHKLGDDAKSSFASIEQEDQRYLDEALDPWLCTWEDECNSKLLTEREIASESHFIEFVRGAIVSVDHKTKIESALAELNSGGLTENQYMAMMNRPSVPNGDRRRIPANIGYVDDQPPQDDEGDDDSRQEGARACFDDAARRMVKRLGGIAKKNARDPSKYVRSCERMTKERTAIAVVLQPAIMALRGSGGTVADAEALKAADWMILQATEAFLRASECRPADLYASVSEVADVHLETLPEQVRAYIENGE